MKIWGEIPKILGVYDKQKNIGRIERTGTVASKKDMLSISGQAKDYQTVMKALKEVPDVRSEKVNEIAARLESGQYDVSGKDVADRIMKPLLDKKA